MSVATLAIPVPRKVALVSVPSPTGLWRMQGIGLDQVGHLLPSMSPDCLFTSPAPCLEQVHILTPGYAGTSTQEHVPRSVMYTATPKPARQGHVPG